MKQSSSLLKGLTRRSPSGDNIATPGKGSVNTDATRSGVAPTPKTLGPRNA